MSAAILPGMMLSRSTFAILAAGLLASGCVILPVTTESYDPDCRFVTHHMALKAVEVDRIRNCSSNGCGAVILLGLGVAAATTIVSGSVVVVGNVVYWAEHRVNCPAPDPVPAAAPAASASA